MDGWKNVPIGKIATLKYGKSLPADRRIAGPIPVYGSNGIVGWHNQSVVNAAGIIVGRKGTVGAIQFSPVPFCPIDTTYYIAQGDTTADLRFLAYLLQHAKLSRLVSDLVPGLNRDSAHAQVVGVPCDPEEQRQIAAVLSAVQRSIERQERLIALTAELKKALMLKLLTEGTRGEPLKQTEIGMMPKSWGSTRLDSLFSREPSNGMYRPQSDYGRGTLILRIDDFGNDGDTVSTASNRVEATQDDRRRFGLAEGDIVLNRVNSLSHLGKTAIIDELSEPMLFESNMMRFRVDETRIRPAFAFRVLNGPIGKSQIVGAAKRAVAQSSVNQGDVGRLLIPLPPDVAEQDAILSALDAVEAKGDVHVRTGASCESLFCTLLHQLMTARVRVHDLDLTALDTSATESAGVA